MRSFLLLATASVCVNVAATAQAQTIQPLVAEYRGAARGRLELLNQADQPLNVVLEPKGFRVGVNGEVWDEVLPAGVQVKLSASSLRIPARQSRSVFYEVQSSERPVWFVIFANFTGYSRAQFSGVNVQLELPHYVYLLPSSGWRASDISVRTAAYDRETKKLVVIVENRGQDFGRIDTVEVRGERLRASEVGFPLFPKTERRVEVSWAGTDLPDRVVLRSKEFTVERRLLVEPQ